MKGVLIAVLALAMTGCALDVVLMERGGTETGRGSMSSMLSSSEEITIHLRGEEYKGRAVLASGGSFNLASMSGPRSGTAVGSGVSFDTSGNGNILAKSASGKGLRCVFNYSKMSKTGAGVCQDDEARLYDMQISL